MSTVPPTPPPSADAATEPRAADAVDYAGFWVRLGAYLIDTVALVVVQLIFLLATQSEDAAAILGLVVGIAYFTAFPASKWEGTPGKRVLGLRLLRPDGRRLTPLRALARYFAYILSMLPLFIGFIMIAWTEQKRALHDMICDTRVISAEG